MTRLTLDCEDNEFHAIHEAVGRARANAKVVLVSRPVLAALLRDHAAMYQRLKEMGEEPITKGEPK